MPYEPSCHDLFVRISKKIDAIRQDIKEAKEKLSVRRKRDERPLIERPSYIESAR